MRKSMLRVIDICRGFVPAEQLAAMVQGLRGEEREYFRGCLREVAATVQSMPATYGQDGKGDDAVVHLHYFGGNWDWWITEKDIDADGQGQVQAFGMADSGYGPELGYIGIKDMLNRPAINLDLHWTPQTLGQIKAKRGGAATGAPAAAPA